MKKRYDEPKTDLEECKDKIIALLREYNCGLIDENENGFILLWDKDTNKIVNVYK